MSMMLMMLGVGGAATFDVTYDILGGGGGGHTVNRSGGGGGGELLSSTFEATVGTQYTITVGDGGSAGSDGDDSAIVGVATADGGLTASQYSDGRGGSSGSGNAGGSGDNYAAGGGGGDGSTGGNASNQTGGNGGSGSNTTIESIAVGGGGGGAGYLTGGTGGAGAANGVAGENAPSLYAGSGAQNKGGGGGGGYNSFRSGSGGSGRVVLRYPDSEAAASATTGSPDITVSGGYRQYVFTGSGTITF